MSKLITKKKVDVTALAAHLGGERYRDDTFGALGVQGIFELYRWMVDSVSGKNHDLWSWIEHHRLRSLVADLGGRPGCVSQYKAEPFRGSPDRHQDSFKGGDWRPEMIRRVGAALFSCGKMAEWRREHALHLPKMIAMRVYDTPPPPPYPTLEPYNFTEASFGKELDRFFLLAHPSRRTIQSLNVHHPAAKYVTAVNLGPTPTGWVASMEYGGGGSSWDRNYDLDYDSDAINRLRAEQGPKEPFVDFIYRAYAKFNAQLTPECTRRRGRRCYPKPMIGRHSEYTPGMTQCEEGM